MDTDRDVGWISAAQLTLALAVFVTAVECSTFLWRLAPQSPGWSDTLYGFYGLVYFCTVVIGIPATVITAIVVGFKRGRPRRLGLVSGLLVLAGFGMTVLALVTLPA